MLVTGFNRGDALHCGDLFRTAADCGFTKIRTGHQLYDEKRTDVKVPLGPDEVPELPYWMK